MIRPAREADIPALMEIYNEAVRNTTATFDLDERDYADRKAWFDAHTGRHVLYVYEADGVAVGYGSLSKFREKSAYDGTAEISLYIHPDYRRRGIGRALMEELIRAGRENPELHTLISCITAENAASIAMHERFGFESCGRIREAGVKFGRYLDIVYYQMMV